MKITTGAFAILVKNPEILLLLKSLEWKSQKYLDSHKILIRDLITHKGHPAM